MLYTGRMADRGEIISVWRVVSPPGYGALGDVVSLGMDPPTAPVTVCCSPLSSRFCHLCTDLFTIHIPALCFHVRASADIKEPITRSCRHQPALALRLEQASLLDTQPNIGGLTLHVHHAQVYRNDADEKGPEKPMMAHPGEFHLVFRENGRSPVTMWEPVAPEGYAALGTLVEGSPQMPDPAEVLCVREDLLRRTGYFDSAIWRWDPPGLQASLPGCPLAASHFSLPPTRLPSRPPTRVLAKVRIVWLNSLRAGSSHAQLAVL